MPPASGPSWRGSAGKPAAEGEPVPAGDLEAVRPRGTQDPMAKDHFEHVVGFDCFRRDRVVYLSDLCARLQSDWFAVMAPAPYSNPAIPPQPFGKRDADDFRDRFAAESFLPTLESKRQEDGSAISKKKSTSSRSRKTIVIFITALAGQTNDGPILYRAESGPDDTDADLAESNGYLPLERLWKSLSELPSEQKKILAIDIAAGPIDWRWGQFVRPNLGSMSDNGE